MTGEYSLLLSEVLYLQSYPALYRLVELSSGSVLIDGQDTSKIGLADLRNALAIIPQDPLLCMPHDPSTSSR